MESKDELKEIDIKNHAFYYFYDIIKDIDINFNNIVLDNKLYEKISFYEKLQRVENHCVLGSIK